MKDRVNGKRVIVVVSIIMLAVGLFIGGVVLVERYQTTIVDTYDKYYDKYYATASSYIEEAESYIKKNIELASQKK